MTKFIKVCVIIQAHPNYSNRTFSVIRSHTVLLHPCHVYLLSFIAIYNITPCSTSILPQPNLASPFRRTRDLWYTSTRVKRCTISPAWDLGEAEDSILDNTDVHFRPRGVSFRLFLRWPQSHSFSW